MKIKNLSASMLEKWDQCPLLCKTVYEDGIKEPPSEAAAFGTAIHATMETVVNASKDAFFPMSYELVLPKMLEKHGVQARFREATELVVQAIRWGYMDGLTHMIGVEKEFKFTLPDGTTVHGYIDRLDWDKTTDTLTVYDLKTGKAPPREKLVKAWQTRIYNWAARKLFPAASTCQVKYLYLRTRQEVVPVTAADAAKTELDMTENATAIRETTEPKPKTGPLCQYCPLYQAKKCPAFATPNLERFNAGPLPASSL
jgi:putative RecB family exonuclease